MRTQPLPVLGTFIGALLTALTLVAVDSPLTQAQEASVQQQTQEDLAERARDLVERFTQQREAPDSPLNSEPTVPTESMAESEPAPFDPGPTESFMEAQGMEEPVDNLPDSGFGIPVATLALGMTLASQRKRFSKYLRTS